jgi:hypothetical protein
MDIFSLAKLGAKEACQQKNALAYFGKTVSCKRV